MITPLRAKRSNSAWGSSHSPQKTAWLSAPIGAPVSRVRAGVAVTGLPLGEQDLGDSGHRFCSGPAGQQDGVVGPHCVDESDPSHELVDPGNPPAPVADLEQLEDSGTADPQGL